MPGLTNSVPLNLGAGGTIMGANNLAGQAGGGDTNGPALVLGILWHVLFPSASGKWTHVALLVAGTVLGLAIFVVFGHLDPVQGVTKAFGVGAQSWFNHLGLKVGGFEALTGGAGTTNV